MTARIYLSAALSGLLFALAFPPAAMAWLAPVALTPWILALWRENGRARAVLSGVVFGLVFWCVSVPWISFVVTHFGGQPGWMGAICVFLLALILAEWPAIVAGVVVLAFPSRSAWRFVAFPVAWMASEHARAYAYKGFPWNLTANALALHPVWIQTASWWGAFGVGALVAGFAAACGAILAAPTAVKKLRIAGGALAAVAALWAFGFARLRAPESGTPVRVACLQPNIPQTVREDPDLVAANYVKVLTLAGEAAASRPDLILIPESSFYGLEWSRSPTLRRDLGAVSAEGQSAILFNDVDEMPDGRYFNAARLLTPAGMSATTYHKVHLVPFGEYVPLPKLFFFMHEISKIIGAFTAAKSPVLLTSGALALGPAVCYEMTYPSLARDEARMGANLLVSVSNDAWYGRAGAQAQHLRAMPLRAVEVGRPFVRAAITGISAAVDSRGRMLAGLPENREGIVRATVRLESGATVWSRWGGVVFPAASDAAVVCMVVWGFVRWRRPSSKRVRYE
ncbi:MAG: apolipoprotein N-acyltransferase [Thermoanaerobaculia bacterium]